MTELVLFQTLLVSGLLYLVWLVLGALEEGAWSGRLSEPTARAVHWMPRLGILSGAAITSVLAVDAFDPAYRREQFLLALAAHLVPTFVMLIVAGAAWRSPLAGSVVLTLWSSWYLAGNWGSVDMATYASLAAIPFFLGILFLLDWRHKAVGSGHAAPSAEGRARSRPNGPAERGTSRPARARRRAR